ncbi:MAG: metalloendopeptidase-like membrane protein [Bacteroidetes bacterium]|nr:MAG: metalloendopeptidase-like membrane protein [Bacteroidota bacterium]
MPILAPSQTKLWTVVIYDLKPAKHILLLLFALFAGINLFATRGHSPLVLRGDTVAADTTDPAAQLIKPAADTTEVPRLGPDDAVDTNEVKKPVSPLEAIEDAALTNDEVFSEDWDTTMIHTDKFDVLSFNDTVNLKLIGSYTCGYSHPIEGHKTSDFGFRRYRYHFGVDIDLETGDSVSSVFDGKVRITNKSKSYGYVVVVRHNNGLETYYAHLSKILVKPGQEIKAGEVLGLGGNTGRSRGSHLHFEVRYKGQPINPNTFIDFEHHQLRHTDYELSKADFKYLTETFKVTTRSKKGKRRTYYYTPGGAKMATPEAKAAMAGVSKPEIVTGKSPVDSPKKETNTPTDKEVKSANTAAKTTPKTPQKQPAGAAVYHSIKKGDTLSALAVKYHTTVTKICQLNGIKSTTVLQIGRKLRVK